MASSRSLFVHGLLSLGLLTASAISCAQSTTPDPREAAMIEMKAANEAAKSALRTGPTEIKLLDQATLKLPDAYGFIPGPEATRLLRAMGNRMASEILGMVVPRGDGDWFATLRYIPSGYIKDDDAKEWNAADMLASIKEGTEESNRERRRIGVPEMEIIDWVEKPAYDAGTHRLVWSLSSKPKGSTDAADRGVNYNTYALGREGYLSLNWVTELAVIEKEKPQAKALLAALDFSEGKRYTDFNAKTDRVAEYGLAALVAGAAAKKLGLLAAIGVFLVKFWKIALIGLVFLGAPLAKLFGRKKKDAETPPAA